MTPQIEADSRRDMLIQTMTEAFQDGISNIRRSISTILSRPGMDDLGKRPLRKLTYVVFDTETTGLHPSQGDEIIQLGAIRIVNGRMLREEIIDQLVDPRRSVPPESVAIHGIDPARLVGQPIIDQVLPHFHKFAEGAVLVAHNAAFDMRLLQLKERRTGLRFDNPVLDTMLLSSIVRPNQRDHSVDAIAEMLNLTIHGRHTALGGCRTSHKPTAKSTDRPISPTIFDK